MKASQLYVGEFYAWHAFPPKGGFTTKAQKVQLRGIERKKLSYHQNARTVARITVVETGKDRAVRAREIIDFWDNYERELGLVRNEEAEAKALVHRQNLKIGVIEELVRTAMKEKTGMEVGRFNYNNSSFTISAKVLMDWLGISDSDIERAIDEHS